MPAIECSELTKRYRGHAVVDRLSLSVDDGEIFGFLGPNGAGKTTTIRMLLGLCRPSSGSARLLGNTCPPPANVLTQVGAMVEEPAFYPWMTVRSHLATINDSCGLRVSRSRREAVLENVGLADVATKKIKHLSQGMRQRLGMAAALLRDPRLLILDEPANGLDPAGTHWLRELLSEVAATGTTVLFSSHQLGEVERICNRVAIIDKGRLVHSGPIDKLGSAEQRVRVVVRTQDHDAALAALSHYSVNSGPQGNLSVSNASVRDVVCALAEQSIFPEEVVKDQYSLEERFLDLTGGAS
jgi:ABC-2 type transport system ATP-binding protein